MIGTVTGRFLTALTNGTQVPLSGQVKFTPDASAVLVSGTDPATVLPAPVVAELDSTGRLTVDLQAPGADTNPLDWTYTVEPQLWHKGQRVNYRPWSIEVLPGATVDLTTAAAVPTVQGEYTIVSPDLALEGYATEAYVDQKVNAIVFPEPDLTGYATEVYVTNAIQAAEPDLTPYVTEAELPALTGLRRSPTSYLLPGNTVVRIPDADIPRQGLLWMIVNGDSTPGPLWMQVYREGLYNGVHAFSNTIHWITGDSTQPTTGSWQIWVDGQGEVADLCVWTSNNWAREVRFYWLEL